MPFSGPGPASYNIYAVFGHIYKDHVRRAWLKMSQLKTLIQCNRFEPVEEIELIGDQNESCYDKRQDQYRGLLVLYDVLIYNIGYIVSCVGWHTLCVKDT